MIFGRGGGGGIVNRVLKRPTLPAARSAHGLGRNWGARTVHGDLDQPLSSAVGLRLNGLYRGQRELPPPVDSSATASIRPRLRSPGPTRGSTSATNISMTVARRTAAFPPTAMNRCAASRATSLATRPRASQGRRQSRVGRASSIVRPRPDAQNRTQFGDYRKFYQNIFPSEFNAGTASSRSAGYNNLNDRTACSARPTSSGTPGSAGSIRPCCSASSSAAKGRATGA